VANEQFIATASQRDTLLALAETYGYAPTGYKNATCFITLYNNSGSIVSIPAGTRVTGEVIGETADNENSVNTVTFTTLNTISVPAAVGGARGEVFVLAEEGEYNTVEANNIYGVILGESTGAADQTFNIEDDPIIADSIEVYVESGITYKKWTKVQHLIDYGPNDAVFTTRFDKDNRVFVLFGDGISGAIPTAYATIRAKYTVGGGTIGNVANSTIDTLAYVPGLSETQTAALAGIIDVENTSPGVGGSEPESNDSIRRNAPKFLRTIGRAITLDDYVNLALSVENCGKANAVSSGYTSVTLYVAPQRDDNDGDATPGVDSLGAATAEWNTLRDSVASYLSSRTLAGVSVTITQPTYVPITIGVEYVRDPAYTVAQAQANLKAALVDNFSYNYVNFGELITAQDIEFVIQNIPGIARAKTNFLYKSGGSSGLSQIQALPNEVLTFSEADVLLEAI
jgi:predicted phage baseplate assembly protein